MVSTSNSPDARKAGNASTISAAARSRAVSLEARSLQIRALARKAATVPLRIVTPRTSTDVDVVWKKLFGSHRSEFLEVVMR
jgi:hypothetical protein